MCLDFINELFCFFKVQQLEDKYHRSINKSRPYFEEKQICQDQLQTQKERIDTLQEQIKGTKVKYANSLRNLEQISEEIHKKRGEFGSVAPPGPREPGVGAELNSYDTESLKSPTICMNDLPPLPDYNTELDKCEIRSVGTSVTTSSAVSEKDENSDDECNDLDLEELKQKVKVLAIRPIEGGDGQQEQDVWENELNATVNKLDQLMMLHDMNSAVNSLPTTPSRKPMSPVKMFKMLKMADPLPLLNVSMNVLPTGSQNSSNFPNETRTKYLPQKRRKLSE